MGSVGSAIGGVLGSVGGGVAEGAGATDDYRAGIPESEYNAIDPTVGSLRNNVSDQQALAKILLAQSQGQGPNPALDQLNLTTGQNAQQAASLLASQRALNPGLAAQLATQQQTSANQLAGGQAALLRSQNQLGSQTSLGNLYGQIGNQQNQFLNNLNSGQLGVNQINASAAAQNAQTRGQVTGGLLSGAGAGVAAAASDEKLKVDVKDANKSIYNFLDAIKAHSYQYKDKDFGKGEQHSVMAQELEKTPVGKPMVENTPAGKMVDYGKGFGAILAAQASLHERLKKLEGKGK